MRNAVVCGLEGELLLIYDISLTSQTARWGADTSIALKAIFHRASRAFFRKLTLKWESPVRDIWSGVQGFFMQRCVRNANGQGLAQVGSSLHYCPNKVKMPPSYSFAPKST